MAPGLKKKNGNATVMLLVFHNHLVEAKQDQTKPEHSNVHLDPSKRYQYI